MIIKNFPAVHFASISQQGNRSGNNVQTRRDFWSKKLGIGNNFGEKNQPAFVRKMGYRLDEKTTVINDRLTLVFYRK